jgi:hypothetical protein
MTTIPDLWPQSFGEPPQPPPVVILRQQGLLLGKRTDNLVYGEVHSQTLPLGQFAHVLEVVAPLLAFRQPIVIVGHSVDVYPTQIGRPDLSNPTNRRGFPTIASPKTVTSSQEFMAALEEILKSEETLKLIQTLIGQCADPEPTPA